MGADQSVRNILVVKLRTLGDVLTTFPLLRALKARHPAARLTFIADADYRDLLEPNPRVDAFWPHPVQTLRSQGAGYALKQHLGMIREIRRKSFDLYIDLYGSLRTALWGFMAGIPRRLGFDLRGRRHFYTQRIRAAHRYVVDLNLQFAQALGGAGGSNAMEFFVTPEDETRARAALQQQGWEPGRPFLTVSPGGGWPLKQWGAGRFGRVAGAIARTRQAQVVITGSQAEGPLMEQCATELKTPVIKLPGLPLRQVASVIKASRLFLGNDSGPKYFAEAFGVPTLICYGPTDFLNNNPQTPRNRALYHDAECRPCHSEHCSQARRVCLDDLTEREVQEAALALWDAR